MDSPLGHLRVEEYSYRVPTPPRIVVPPPSINASVVPQFNLRAPADHPILGSISYAGMTTSSLLDWSYERRREAQAILPFLYLGPLNAAKDRNFLRKEGITMVLGIRQRHSFESRIMNAALRVADELGIQYKTVDLGSERDLVSVFGTAEDSINDHMAHTQQLYRKGQTGVPEMGKILVFCESGNERSAAVVAAYLMSMHPDVDYIRAMQVCQSQRFCVNFDDNIKRSLQSYWDIISARRMVHEQHATSQGGPNLMQPSAMRGSGKRSLGRDEDDDMDMDGLDDTDRFERRAFAPFV